LVPSPDIYSRTDGGYPTGEALDEALTTRESATDLNAASARRAV
jgi:hypothetical protein